MQTKTIAIGLFAGVAAGLMAAAALRPGAFVLPMLFAAPAAVYMASLGWGTVAGALAAIAAAVVAGFMSGPPAALSVAALFFVPAAWAGHLANLAQPAPDGRGLVWFPLSGILLRLAAALVSGFIVTGVVLGYDPVEIETALRELLAEIVKAGGGVADDAAIAGSARAYIALLPAVVPGMWLMLHVLVMHLSAIVTARSGVLARPAEDIAATLTLPPAFVGAVAAAGGGMIVLPSPGYEIAALVFGAGVAALALVGLAQVHLNSRGKPGRGLLLALTYGLLVVLGFPALVLAVFGAIRCMRGPVAPPPPPALPRS